MATNKPKSITEAWENYVAEGFSTNAPFSSSKPGVFTPAPVIPIPTPTTSSQKSSAGSASSTPKTTKSGETSSTTPKTTTSSAADAFKPAPALAGIMLGSLPVNDKALDFDYSMGQTPANSFQSNALSKKGQEMKSNRWDSVWGWLKIIGNGLSGGSVSAKDMQAIAETTKERSAAAKSAKAEYNEMRETDPLYLAKQAENEARKDYYRLLSAARQSGYINVSADEVDEAKAKLDAAAKEVERLGGVSNTSPFATWVKGAAESVAGGVKTAAGWVGNAYKYRAETMPKLWDATFGDEQEKAEAEKVYDEAAERANNANALMKSGFNTLEQASADTAMAKYGEREGKQVLIDIGTQAIPMAGDIALNAVAPGSGLAAMGVRAFGSGVYEAAQHGADFATQGAYGAATAAVEVLTEKMFDAFGGLAYGKGASDVLVDALVARLAGTPAGRTAWRLALNATGEGFEEFVSGVADGFLDVALLNADPSEAWDPAEIAYEFFIGAVMGFFGAGPTMISGANIRAEAVSEFFAAQAKEGKTFKEAIAAYRDNEEKVNAVAAIRLAARQNGMGPLFAGIAENLLGDEAKADVVKAFQSIAAGVLYDEESQSYKMAAEMAASLNDAVKGNGSIVEAYKNIDAKDLLALRNAMEAEREKYGPKDLTEEDSAALTEVIQPEATVVKTEVTTLTKAGIDVTEATAIAQMIDSIVGGQVPSKNSVSKVLVGERVFGGAQDMAVKALFEQMTGKHIPEGATTKAQLKALYMTAIQEYVTEKQAEAEQSGRRLDNPIVEAYNTNNNATGAETNGNENIAGDAGEAQTGESDGRKRITGVSGVGMHRGTAPGVAGYAITDQLRNKMTEKGIVNTELRELSAEDGALFASSIDAARKADPKYGTFVAAKSEEDVQAILRDGGKVFLSSDGLIGAVVTKDGDIEGVFKNKNSKVKPAIPDILVTAILSGGNKLDCFGKYLVNTYAKYGFTPVARALFDPAIVIEYDGWTQEQIDEYRAANDGHDPDIYFMMHNGDSADTVVEKLGSYKSYTQAELDALPAMEYDEAAKFRDEQLDKSIRESDEPEKSNPRPDKVLRFSDGAVLDRAGFYAQMDGVENPQTGKPYTKAEMKDLFDKLYEYNKTTGAIPGGPGRSTTGRFMLGENVTASNETGEKLTSAQEWTAKFVSEVMAEKGYVTEVVFTRQEGADGQMLNGVLYLNPDTLNDYFALQMTLFHELFHRGREGEKANNAEMDEKLNDGKIHSGMIESVLANFQEFARWGFFGDEGRRHFADPKAQIEAVREKYKTFFSSRINPDTGAVYTPAELDSLLTETYCAEEVAANWLGAALANENALTKMAGVSPSTVSTILEKVQSLKSRLRGDQLSKDARMMRKAVDEMEAELYEALDVASQLPASIDEGTVRAKVKDMSWEDQIDAVLNQQKTKADGTYDWNADLVRGSALYIPETPKRLLDIGLPKVPMAYTQKHLLTAMLQENVDDNGHALRGGHGISADVLKRLPKLISSPVMLIASPTVPGDVIVVTSEVSERGWPIVASIHPSANGGTAVIDGSVTAANFITSVYPREDFDVTIKDAGQKRDSFVSRAASGGRILWADKEGFDALMAVLDEKRSQITGWATRTEGPGISSIGIDFNKIIRQVKPVVKGRKSEGRFKLTGDAFGAPLSAQTQEYFKDSVARVGYTTDGALLRWYRRLNDNSGVIDPTKSKIGAGVFWTSDPEVGRGYTFGDDADTASSEGPAKETIGTPEEIESAKIKWDELESEKDNATAEINMLMLRYSQLGQRVNKAKVSRDFKMLRTVAAEYNETSTALATRRSDLLRLRAEAREALAKYEYLSSRSRKTLEEVIQSAEDNADITERGARTDATTEETPVMEEFKPAMVECYLNLTNPLILDCQGRGWNNLGDLSEYGNSTDAIATSVYNNTDYDGVILTNIRDGSGIIADDAIQFFPDQSKGTANNSPTYSPDFRFKLSDDTDYEEFFDTDYAPTFYSKLERVTQKMKQEKIDANSYMSMLKGKGVKDEEIKWSGVGQFLAEHPKTTKTELLDFFDENSLNIDVTTLDDIDPETGLNIREAEEDGGDFAIGETPTWAEDDEWMPEGPPPGFESSEYDDDDTYRTEWSGYKLRSGENYREYVFTMRGSEYSNPAMRTHWKSRTGVLVHARVQDFVEATGKKVLYIEEIQSDWHNAGQKHGYRGGYSPEIQQLLGQRDTLENDYSAMDEYERADAYGRYVADEYERVTTELQDADVNLASAPDAPFKGKGYTDYALKYLIREAAAGGYDYVAWSPAFFQDIRWDDHREHESDKGVSGNLIGYKIEYDQDIPNFLRKYGKQWNAGLSKVLMGVEYEDLSIEDALEMAEDVYNVQEDNYEIGYVDEDDDIMYAVPALEVNAAMRESVLYDGQPRFKVSDAEGEKISRAAFDAMRSRFALADSQDFLDFLTARYTNRSEVRTNTFEYSGIFTEAEKRLEGMREEDFNYNVESERQSMERARERLDADYMAEKQHLMLDDTSWSGEDLDTAMGILTAELDIARKTNAPNAYDEVSDWMHRIAQMGTKAGQMIQAFAKYTRTPEGVLVRAAKDLRQTKLTPQQRTELLDRIRQFANTLCALRDGDKQGIIDLIVEQAKQRKTPVSKSTMSALQKQNYQYLYGTALTQLDQIAKDYIPKSGGRKIATYQTMAHLLNLRTGERNIGSNVVFNLIDTVANDISMVPDLVLSAFTGRRMVGFESTLSKARKEGAAAARSKAHVEIALDVAPESSQDKYGTARRTWKMVGGVGSKVMSTLERTMGYELNWTDESTKGGVRAMVMKSLEPAIAQGWITKADAEAMAEQEALYRTFQDETYIGQFLALTKKAFNVFGFGGKGALNHEFGLGDLVIKYTQVPGALITRAIEFSPVGMAKAVWNLHQFNQSNRAVRRARNNLDEITAEWESRGNGKDGKPLIESTRAQNEIRNAQKELALAIQNTNVNQRRAALQIGRTMTGTGLITLFAACALRGVLRRPDDDEDANLKALHSAQGLSGTQFNLSAMMRMFQGESTEWEDGDVLADADFLEPTNALMTMGSLVANSDECQTVWDMFKNPNVLFNKATMNALYHSIGELSVMQTLSTIQNAMTYYDPESPLEEWQTIAIDVARSSMTGFIPAPVRQVATALDPYYRDTYTDTSEWGLTRAQAMNSIPGLRGDLPEKLTNYGALKEQEQNPWLRAANALAVPGSIRTYQQSDLTDELDRLADATGKATFVPARNAPYSDTFDDEKFELTPEQRQRYQTIRGRTTVEMMNAVMDDPLYKSASATDQAAMLNDARNYANYLARKDLASSLGTEYSSSTYEAWTKAMDNGISLPAYNTISPMLSTGDSSPFHGDDRKDKIIDYLSDCVLNGTLSTEGANFLFAKAYESYRLKDNDGKRTDEYDWNKLSSLPWNN